MGRYHNLEEEEKAISRRAEVVIPSDTEDLRTESALYVGSGGDLVVDMADGQEDILFKNVQPGSFLPIVVIRVKTASTAADILAIN